MLFVQLKPYLCYEEHWLPSDLQARHPVPLTLRPRNPTPMSTERIAGPLTLANERSVLDLELNGEC
ncbi:hypothetical protein, partial [Nocardia cyriacigeorgica]|uniref:hypothetical protein n=1 Tax=Nocardia cyriacigeorgica TaxID=135487 RepID=UPI001E5FA1A6